MLILKGGFLKNLFTKKSPGGGGKRRKHKQFCNTRPNHPSCKGKDEKKIEEKTGSSPTLIT